jgi:XapX domain-containing protein
MRDEVAVIERTINMGYIISLGVGFAVGLLYWLLKVQSPAPPLIALAGLLGMVLGEHAIPVVKAQLFAQTPTVQVAEPMKSTAVQRTASRLAVFRLAEKGDGGGKPIACREYIASRALARHQIWP